VPRPIREPRGPSPLVPALLRFAAARGVVANDLSLRFELPEGAAAADEADIAPSDIRALFDAVSEACAEPHVGLRLGAERPRARVYAPLELAVRSSDTVGLALTCLAEHALLVHPLIAVTVTSDDDGLRWVQTDPPPPRGIGRHAVEHAMAFALSRCREALTHDPLRVVAAWFVHPRPRDITPLERYFGTTHLSFGMDDSGFSLPRASADLAIDTKDHRLLRTARDLAASDLVRSAAKTRTTSLVESALPSVLRDGPTLETVARTLAVSARTLQRRLDEEGTTFNAVLEGVREARARRLLRDEERPLADVAEDLGFADLATFSRAFKRWTGRPPGMFRRGLVRR
jgi:AraC-like DNA-binding protein